MDTLPCQGCKGMCCGPVPVSDSDLKAIRKKLKIMTIHARKRLEKQQRYHGTCIFYDMELDRCGIHSARPAVCRAFGLHRNLVCFRLPDAASEGLWHAPDRPVGILSTDFVWKDFR